MGNDTGQIAPLPELTVLCFLWDGWRPGVYGPEHVRQLQAMCERHLSIPHRFVCVTNQTVDGVETVPLPELPWVKNSPGIPCGYYKLWAFSPEAAALGKRLLVLDLDTLIVRDIAPMLTADPFKVRAGYSCPYGTCIFQLTAGAFPHVWESLTPEVAKKANQQRTPQGGTYYGSDQAVAAYLLPGMPTWGRADGLVLYTDIPGDIPDDARVVVYAGPIKPWNSRFADLYWNGVPPSRQ